MAKVSRPVVYTGLVAVVIAAVYFAPGEPAKGKAASKTKARPTSKKSESLFTEEDYKTRFPRLDVQVKNAFYPVVARRTSGMPGVGLLGPNSIPAELSGGDPNWEYTGTAILDGVPTALLENKVSVEAEFVTQGQDWKAARVARIAPEEIVLVARSGKSFTMRLTHPALEAEPGVLSNNGLQPVTPTLSGPIGADVTVRPESSRRSQRQGQNQETRDAN